MPKIKKESESQEEDFYYKPLEKHQLQALHVEVVLAGGWEKFLRNNVFVTRTNPADGEDYDLHIVTLNKFDQIDRAYTIDGAAGRKVRKDWAMSYATDFPFDTWKKVWEQYSKYAYGLEMSKKERERVEPTLNLQESHE